MGTYGSQIAVDGFAIDVNEVHWEYFSTLDITYSDVQLTPSRAPAWAPIDADTLPVVRPGFNSQALAANDDGSTGMVDIGFEINYFGLIASSLYVNNNGNVTFFQPLGQFTPFGLTTNIGTPIIAPFFADVDTSGAGSPLVTYGQGTVDGHNAFGANWLDVGYFAQHMDNLNRFQLILIERPDRGRGSFDIELNYEQIQWETGDASGGIAGLGGQSANVGFSRGTGLAETFYEFAGSGINGAFLDTNITTGLIHGSRNSLRNGRYIFSVNQGILDELLVASVSPLYIADDCIFNGEVIHDWDPNGFTWDAETHNLEEDPLFIGDYYLSQIAAGQLSDSNCVDAGSDLVENISADPNMYTTRTDSVPDKYDGIDPCSAIVDMGYHRRTFVVPQYSLTVTPINVDGLPEINFSIHPESTDGFYNQYTTVRLTVDSVPAGYQAKWAGTDDDTVADPVNYVTMDSNKEVRITYVPQYHLTVTAVDVEGLPEIEVALDPPGYNGYYNQDTKVKITVTEPPAGYDVLWTGTDDDTVTDPNNYVTMDFDRDVFVTYTLNVTKYYAVICGISNYAGIGSDLLWPAYDAVEFHLTLLDAPNWDTQNVTLLWDSAATKAAIRTAIDNTAARLDDNDVFVFYFSGHGTTSADIDPFDEIDGLDEYLVTYNFQNIRDDELGEWFATLPTENYIVFIDSCFAGGNAQGALTPR
ncbi:MAG: nidogen-like domain-containing protein, partial [Planctomycetota bacterium]